MASKIKVDQIQTADGTGTIALQNQLSGMTTASLPALGSAQMPTGSVLQVVQGTFDESGFTTTSTSAVATGADLSITPTTSGNKMLVTVSGLLYNSGGDSAWGSVQIKDTTNGTFSANNTKIGRNTLEEQFTVSHLFTTTSTSVHNYELYSGAADSGTKIFDNTLITIMEIAG